MARSKNRGSNEINASSMADIAFLLLIFFLVTTTIAQDKGIQVLLPPWSEDAPDPAKLNKRNVFAVLVNADNQLLVRGELANITELRERAKEFISNPGRREDLAESPQKAIISLKNDRSTKYGVYIEVYNELKAAYQELWNDLSQRLYGEPYSEEMSDAKKRVIRTEIPFVLSEAEPTDFGNEG